MLHRLQIVGFKATKAPFLSHPISSPKRLRRTVETNPPRSPQLSCSLHTYLLLSRTLFYHARKSRYCWLDPLISPRREFDTGRHQRQPRCLPRPIMHGFPPAFGSLSLAYSSVPPPKFFNFISSLPLLEDSSLSMMSRTPVTPAS